MSRAKSITLGTIGGLLVGFISVVGAAWALSTRAATLVVAPVENKLDQHLAAVAEARKVMEAFAEKAERRLDAICRKTNCDKDDQ